MTSTPRLEKVTRQNVLAACRLKLKPEQEGLVAPVSWSLAQAYVIAPEKIWPRLVYDGDQIVGFIMAAFDPDNELELWHSFLWRLFIAADHQGQGYGRFALEELYAEALGRGNQRLMTSWEQREHGPENFYLRLGFRLTGEKFDDEVIGVRSLAQARRS
jgi:diamine N-acetyltransferase